ncbi:23 kDa integral membrane protein-like [Watersipora subatra]|uniref:23 kDa integral membrane protein-like n=1 Tax=Watersipora subatra TaxID=2589382 RepID=UPI00355AFD6A
MGSEPGLMGRMARYLFIGFNALFTIFGLGLIIAGSYGVAQAKTLPWDKIKEYLVGAPDSDEAATRSALIGIAAVVIVMGLITMSISSCGWLGACKQNTCLLFTFSVSMAIIILLEFILGIAVLVTVKNFTNPENKGSLEAIIKEAETEYNNRGNNTSTPAADAFDFLQANGTCCGIYGPDDYTIIPIPATCYKDGNTKTDPSSVGCLEAYSDMLKNIASGVGGVAIGFCVIEIFGLVISCYLACNMRKGTPYEQH